MFQALGKNTAETSSSFIFIKILRRNGDSERLITCSRPHSWQVAGLELDPGSLAPAHLGTRSDRLPKEGRRLDNPEPG